MKPFLKSLGILCAFVLYTIAEANEEPKYPGRNIKRATGPCDENINVCDWNNWSSWGDCTGTSCDSANQKRVRGLCCEQNQTFAECAVQCKVNITSSSEDRPCIPCFHNGTYISVQQICVCQPYYTGQCCETSTFCDSQPCQNNGTCTDVQDGYTCSCPPGFTGPNCETDIDECDSNPCQNGGTCVDKVNNYTCICGKQDLGPNCETVCEDLKDNCFYFDDDKCVDVYAQWAEKNCAFRCGYCPEKPPCVNTLDYCNNLNKADCTNPNYLGYMRTNCRQFCDLCIVPNVTAGGSGQASVTPGPQATGQIPHKEGDVCYDKLPNDQCFNYNDANCYGIYKPWALENCKVRCGFCYPIMPPCVDQIPNCNLYSKSDCVKYDKWGRYTCRKFCDRCVPPTQSPTDIFTTPTVPTTTVPTTEATTEPTTTEATTTPMPTESTIPPLPTGADCVDKLSECATFDEESCVGVFESWARVNCPRRCGFCTGDLVDCIDYVRDCEHLPDVCTAPQYQEFARTNCRRYCNLCNGSLNILPNTGETTVAPTTEQITIDPNLTKSYECRLQKLDILFMMDASGSVTEPSFVRSLDFVSNFTEFFQIGPDNTQVSVYSFDNRNVYGFNLNKYQEPTSLRNAINVNNIHYYALKENFTMALQFARETVFAAENGARNDSLKVIIFITDGKSKVGNQVELLRQQSIQIIAVGIGNQTDIPTLKKIATSPSNVFTVGSYDAINTIQDVLQNATCSANKFCESGPCKNQGTCINLQNDYHCICLPGTSGKDCSQNRNECDPNPCLNNGVCIDGINTYTCDCKGGYAGKNCETKLLACSKGVDLCEWNEWLDWGPCTGQCNTATQQRIRGLCCETVEPFETCAQQCNKSVSDAFDTRPCQVCNNGGVYVSQLQMCACPSGYSGDCCQIYTPPSTVHPGHLIQPPKGTIPALTLAPNTTVLIDTNALECRRQKFDILFLVDASGSVTIENFEIALNFVRNFTRFFEIGPQFVQVGVFSFDNRNVYGFNLNKYQDKDSLEAAINTQNIEYHELSENFTLALSYARNEVFTKENGERSDALNVIVFITDGKSEVGHEAELLKQENVQIIALGVGNETQIDNLRQIASSDNYVFNASSYEVIQTIEEALKNATCTGYNFCARAPCLNNGTCTDLQNGFQCTCVPGYFGATCQNETNECEIERCMNGGTCVDELNGYHCICPPGYTGPNCRIAIQACSNDVGLCEFNQWGDWGQCSGTCYAATQTRFRGLCCEQLEPFGTCAQKCNRTIDEAIQTRNCLICNNGGVFVEELMMCVCINGYSGPCCDEYFFTSPKPTGHNLFPDITTPLPPTTEPATTEATTTEATTKAPSVVCKEQKIDISFLLDASGSVLEENFLKELEFVRNVTGIFNIGPDHSQISVYSFDNRGLYGFYLNAYDNATELESAININNIKYNALSENFTMALKFAREQIFTADNGARNDSLKVVVFITDGKSFIGNEAERLRNEGVQIFAVGIGNETQTENLREIASTPSNVFLSPTYDIINHIPVSVFEATCTVLQPCDSNPCQNGGTCVNIPDGFRCDCDTGFTGQNCESVKNQSLCDNGVNTCGWNNWEPWGVCGGQCEAGQRERIRGLCCERGQNFTECAFKCNIPLEVAIQNATQSEPCAICNNGGEYVSALQQCRCPKYYNGTCCDNYFPTEPPTTVLPTPTPKPGPCDAGHDICDWNNWMEWEPCSECGAVQRRRRGLCCPGNESFDQCAANCNRTFDQAFDSRSCVVCNNGGFYNTTISGCVCAKGYDGVCCNIAEPKPGNNLLPPLKTQAPPTTVTVATMAPTTLSTNETSAPGNETTSAPANETTNAPGGNVTVSVASTVAPGPVCDVNVSFCEWNNWSDWGQCTGACLMAIQQRTRTLCCNGTDECYQECNVSRSDALDDEPCHICNNGGVYVSSEQACRCAEYYNGTCCDNYYPTQPPTTASTLPPTTVPPSPCDTGVQICGWNHWESWQACSSNVCGSSRQRVRGLCCEVNATFTDCLSGCNKSLTDAFESGKCPICNNGGVYDESLQQCSCASGYAGECCDVAPPTRPSGEKLMPVFVQPTLPAVITNEPATTAAPSNTSTENQTVAATTAMPAEVCGVNVSFCEWNAWGPKSVCDGACGQATTTKRRTLCCNSTNLDDCFQECNISRDGSFEINPCRPCNNGGVYVPALQECQCAEYYNGTCCDDYWPTEAPSTVPTVPATTQAPGPCDAGVFQCDWNNWEDWEPCDQCGSSRRRIRALCCEPNSTFSECLVACNRSISEASETGTCPICLNLGIFNTATDQCDCLAGYTGQCCENFTVVATTAGNENISTTQAPVTAKHGTPLLPANTSGVIVLPTGGAGLTNETVTNTGGGESNETVATNQTVVNTGSASGSGSGENISGVIITPTNSGSGSAGQNGNNGSGQSGSQTGNGGSSNNTSGSGMSGTIIVPTVDTGSGLGQNGNNGSGQSGSQTGNGGTIIVPTVDTGSGPVLTNGSVAGTIIIPTVDTGSGPVLTNGSVAGTIIVPTVDTGAGPDQNVSGIIVMPTVDTGAGSGSNVSGIIIMPTATGLGSLGTNETGSTDSNTTGIIIMPTNSGPDSTNGKGTVIMPTDSGLGKGPGPTESAACRLDDLSGYVTDLSTGKGLQFADVSSSELRSDTFATTNNHGYYYVRNNCLGNATLYYMREGYITVQATPTVLGTTDRHGLAWFANVTLSPVAYHPIATPVARK